MTKQAKPSPRPKFTMGNVLGTSFTIIGRNFVPFAVIAVGISIPSIFIHYQMFWPSAVRIPRANGFPSLLETMLVALLTSNVTAAALIYGTFQDLRGRRVGIGDSITHAFARLVPVLGAAVAYCFLVTIGTLLLIIPGIVVMLTLWVYIPAVVVEKLGVGAAFDRSWRLTKGGRIEILALLCVIGLLYGFIPWCAGMAGVLAFGFIGWFCATQASGILIAMLSAVTVAVSYYFLRADKEGVDIDEIAKIFD